MKFSKLAGVFAALLFSMSLAHAEGTCRIRYAGTYVAPYLELSDMIFKKATPLAVELKTNEYNDCRDLALESHSIDIGKNVEVQEKRWGKVAGAYKVTVNILVNAVDFKYVDDQFGLAIIETIR